MSHRIGFLATGTELVQGDILNTNVQHMARELTEQHYPIGMHMMVSDDQSEILQALEYLVESHDIIIVTGGLGPTTDDRTRYALSELVSQPLVFHDESWDYIMHRLSHYGLTITENNRQQAMFPASAIVLDNPNGTANGCKVSYTHVATGVTKVIYLMPGPPNECLPMFEHYVFPDLAHYLQQQPRFKKKWRLFNVSESHIAAELEQALMGFNVVTGYRIDYPYLEFKIEAPINCDVGKLLTAVTPLIKPHLLADEYIPASQLLKEKLATLTQPLLIVDDATGGLLQTRLSSKQNYHHVYFAEGDKSKTDFQAVITVSGLKEYWQNLDESKTTTIHMTLSSAAGTQEFNAEIPYRPIRIVKYAVELAASQILNYLKEIKN